MSTFSDISVSNMAKYNTPSKTIKNDMEFVHKKLLDDTIKYNNELELIDYQRFPFPSIYNIMLLHSYKEKNGIIHLYAELYCTANNYHANQFYQLIPGGELEEDLRPSHTAFLNILATDINYCNVTPGFLLFNESGEMKYSLQDPIQRYIFIWGSWSTAQLIAYESENNEE